jgi:hypothetical protein
MYLREDCHQLNSPSDSATSYTLDKRSFYHLKYRPSTREGDIDTDEADMQITNELPVPVTFVVSKMLFGETPIFTPPDQVSAYMALYRVHAEPGETVSLRLGVRWNYKKGTQVPALPVSLPIPKVKLPSETAKFDEWRVSVISVGRNGMLYMITGQLSVPIGAPIQQNFSSLYLSVADEARWSIENTREMSQFRRENNRLVQDFIITTREPGRIPATLLWDIPEATHWLTEPFEFHNLLVRVPPATEAHGIPPC